jgi:membrane protein
MCRELRDVALAIAFCFPGSTNESGAGVTVKIPAIISRIYAEFSADRIPAVAGGVTFFFLLALFPAISSVVSLYGLFADRQSIQQTLQMVSGFLPGGAVSVLGAELHRLAGQKPATLNIAFLLSTVVALWSTSGGIKAVLDGLNIAFETKETRSFIRLSLNAVIFAAGGVAVAAFVIYCVGQTRRLVAGLSWAHFLQDVASVVVWPVALAACSTVVSLIYRYGPNRARTPWRWVTWGSAFASVFWIIGTMAFSWYVQNFGSYNRTYGDLGAAVGFLTWVWISIVILLTGAEITCEVEKSAKRKRH